RSRAILRFLSEPAAFVVPAQPPHLLFLPVRQRDVNAGGLILPFRFLAGALPLSSMRGSNKSLPLRFPAFPEFLSFPVCFALVLRFSAAWKPVNSDFLEPQFRGDEAHLDPDKFCFQFLLNEV